MAKRKKASLVAQRRNASDQYATYVAEAAIWYVYPTMDNRVREASEEKVREIFKGKQVELVHDWEELPESLRDAIEDRLKREDTPDEQSGLGDF